MSVGQAAEMISAAFADAHQATEIAYARWQQELLPIVEEGMASGEFVSGDPQVMIASLTALIDGFGVRLLAGALDPLSIREIFERMEVLGYRDLREIEWEDGLYQVKGQTGDGRPVKLYVDGNNGNVLSIRARN